MVFEVIVINWQRQRGKASERESISTLLPIAIHGVNFISPIKLSINFALIFFHTNYSSREQQKQKIELKKRSNALHASAYPSITMKIASFLTVRVSHRTALQNANINIKLSNI